MDKYHIQVCHDVPYFPSCCSSFTFEDRHQPCRMMIQLLHEFRSQWDSGDASKLCFHLQTFNKQSIKISTQ